MQAGMRVRMALQVPLGARRPLSTNPPVSPWFRKANELQNKPLPEHLKSPVPNLQKKDQSINGASINGDGSSQSQYNDAIKSQASMDPAISVKLIEDELAEVVAGALKKQHDKLTMAIWKAEEALESYESEPGDARDEEYRVLREVALNCRWEMIIHRTACGFRSDNYNFIETLWFSA